MADGQKLRELDALDRTLKEIDYGFADWARNQAARIREAREAVGKLKAAAKTDVKEDPEA